MSEKSPITVILPAECVDAKTQTNLICLAHPRTSSPTWFLLGDNRIWELTAVDGTNEHDPPTMKNAARQALYSARSLLFDTDHCISDARVLIATPINPLFLVLPVLYKNKSRYLTGEYIHDMAEIGLPDGCDALDASIFEPSLSVVCDVSKDPEDGELSYRINLEKLMSHLEGLCTRMVEKNALPGALVTKGVTEPLLPVDFDGAVPASFTEQANLRLSMSLVCSYLTADLAAKFMETKDFSALELHLKELSEKRSTALAAHEALLASSSRPAKRSRSEPEPKTKKPALSKGVRSLAKAKVSNNRSLMDMFAPKSRST